MYRILSLLLSGAILCACGPKINYTPVDPTDERLPMEVSDVKVLLEGESPGPGYETIGTLEVVSEVSCNTTMTTDQESAKQIIDDYKKQHTDLGDLTTQEVVEEMAENGALPLNKACKVLPVFPQIPEKEEILVILLKGLNEKSVVQGAADAGGEAVYEIEHEVFKTRKKPTFGGAGTVSPEIIVNIKTMADVISLKKEEPAYDYEEADEDDEGGDEETLVVKKEEDDEDDESEEGDDEATDDEDHGDDEETLVVKKEEPKDKDEDKDKDKDDEDAAAKAAADAAEAAAKAAEAAKLAEEAAKKAEEAKKAAEEAKKKKAEAAAKKKAEEEAKKKAAEEAKKKKAEAAAKKKAEEEAKKKAAEEAKKKKEKEDEIPEVDKDTINKAKGIVKGWKKEVYSCLHKSEELEQAGKVKLTVYVDIEGGLDAISLSPGPAKEAHSCLMDTLGDLDFPAAGMIYQFHIKYKISPK